MASRMEAEASRSEEPRGEGGPARRVLLDVAALERAFEDTSGETRRYLHVFTGTVTVLHHGSAEPAAFTALDEDARYLRIEPVSRRQQYRWIQEYIATVEDLKLSARLRRVAAGKGAFARFQGVLAPRLREKNAWNTFRLERLHAAIAGWLTARGVLVTAPLVTPDQAMEPQRRRLAEVASHLGVGDLTALVEIARFLAAARDMSGRARASASVCKSV
jgi:Uncharacterised protein family (UPF0158)